MIKHTHWSFRGLFVGVLLFNIFFIILEEGTGSMFIKSAAPRKIRNTPCTLEERSRTHSDLAKWKNDLKIYR